MTGNIKEKEIVQNSQVLFTELVLVPPQSN